jgi:hypothetical protein
MGSPFELFVLIACGAVLLTLAVSAVLVLRGKPFGRRKSED